MDTGKRIKELRTQKGWLQEDLAKRVGVTKATINKYETGLIVNLKRDMISKLAAALDVEPTYLLGFDEVPMVQAVRVPVYGTIPAGEPLEAIEDVLDNIEIPLSWTASGKEYFALKVRGDSMEPEYKENDVVIFEKTFEFENGDDCAIYVNGYDATFKRLYKVDGGIMVQALNPNYPPYTRDDITVLGCAVEIRRKRK